MFRALNSCNIRTKYVTKEMANVTLADAESAFLEAAKPKFISPEIFDPVTSSAHAFLRSFERCAAANGWDDIRKLQYFGTFLKGDANVWYCEYQQNRTNGWKCWSDVKEDFVRNFSGERAGADFRRKLRNLNQGADQSIKEYYYELLELLNELGIGRETKEVQKYFEDGLHERYWDNYYNLADASPSSPDQLRNIVFRLAERPSRMKLEKKCMFITDEPAVRRRTRFVSPPPPVERRDVFMRERRMCYTCGRFGHISYTCARGRTRQRCYVCDREGHVARNCHRRYGAAKSYMTQRSPRQQHFHQPRESFQPHGLSNNRERSPQYCRSPKAAFYKGTSTRGRTRNWQERANVWWEERPRKRNWQNNNGTWKDEKPRRRNSQGSEGDWRNVQPRRDSQGSEDAWRDIASTRRNSPSIEGAQRDERPRRRNSLESEESWSGGNEGESNRRPRSICIFCGSLP